MDDTQFNQELQKRLHEIESPDGPSLIVADLPLRDVALAVVALLVASALLTWWAF